MKVNENFRTMYDLLSYSLNVNSRMYEKNLMYSVLAYIFYFISMGDYFNFPNYVYDCFWMLGIMSFLMAITQGTHRALPAYGSKGYQRIQTGQYKRKKIDIDSERSDYFNLVDMKRMSMNKTLVDYIQFTKQKQEQKGLQDSQVMRLVENVKKRVYNERIESYSNGRIIAEQFSMNTLMFLLTYFNFTNLLKGELPIILATIFTVLFTYRMVHHYNKQLHDYDENVESLYYRYFEEEIENLDGKV